MPNGHGGHVRFFTVVVLLLLLGGLLAAYRSSGDARLAFAGYATAALLGERLAHHVHRWKSQEYDGAYLNEHDRTGARNRYLIGALLYIPGAVAAFHVLKG